MPPEVKIATTIRLRPSLLQQLKAVAAQENRTLSGQIAAAVERDLRCREAADAR